MKSPDKAEQESADFFSQGYNCSQSVLSVFAADSGLDSETALKIAAPFGAGMGRMREVCGAVSGMFMAAGLILSSPSSTDTANKGILYEHIQELARQFKAENGSIICRELLAGTHNTVDTTPAPAERTEQYYKKRPCKDLCACAARILSQYIHQLEKTK